MVAALIALALAASPLVTHDVLPVFVSPPNSSGLVDEVLWELNGTGQPALSLGVFRRPATLADVAPPEARMFAQLTQGRLAQSRLLVASNGIRIYAFPAAGGKVCWVRAPQLGGSCAMSLLDGAYPQVDPRRDVWGLVDDGAVRVDVSVARRVLRAGVTRNAFFLRLPEHVVLPSRIVVHERDGARHVYDVERCDISDFSPLHAPLGPPC